MQTISLHALIAAQLADGKHDISQALPRQRGVFAQKPQQSPVLAPNSVFALASNWGNNH